MKKILILAVLSSAMLFTGCGDSNSKDSNTKEESNVKLKDWYPIDGGYINLRHVKTISSNMSGILKDSNWGAITKDNIEKCKKAQWPYSPFKAYISFDGFKVYLPNASENDRIFVYDSWLKEFQEVERRLSNIK